MQYTLRLPKRAIRRNGEIAGKTGRAARLSILGAIASSTVAMALALLLAAPAAAAGPDGSSPQPATRLAGTATGPLAPGQAAWYSYRHDANLNDALTLKANPPIPMTPTSAGDYTSGAYFNVEWAGNSNDAGFP